MTPNGPVQLLSLMIGAVMLSRGPDERRVTDFGSNASSLMPSPSNVLITLLYFVGVSALNAMV
jgi:hypothetical protein